MAVYRGERYSCSYNIFEGRKINYICEEHDIIITVLKYVLCSRLIANIFIGHIHRDQLSLYYSYPPTKNGSTFAPGTFNTPTLLITAILHHLEWTQWRIEILRC